MESWSFPFNFDIAGRYAKPWLIWIYTTANRGSSQATVNTAVNGITKGMGTAGSNTVNGMIKVDAAVSTVTAVGTAAASNAQTNRTTEKSQQNQNNTKNRPVWQLY